MYQLLKYLYLMYIDVHIERQCHSTRLINTGNQVLLFLFSNWIFLFRNYRYIAKVHLGNILHRARRSDEAVLVLHAAIDHYRHSPVAHITLGNVYATLAFYNV